MMNRVATTDAGRRSLAIKDYRLEDREGLMASYRLFYVERAQLEYGASFDAEDDIEAGKYVRQRQYGRVAELWNQDRYVAEYLPTRASLHK